MPSLIFPIRWMGRLPGRDRFYSSAMLTQKSKPRITRTIRIRKFDSCSFAIIRGLILICIYLRDLRRKGLSYRFLLAQSPTRFSASSRFSMELAMLKRR